MFHSTLFYFDFLFIFINAFQTKTCNLIVAYIYFLFNFMKIQTLLTCYFYNPTLRQVGFRKFCRFPCVLEINRADQTFTLTLKEADQRVGNNNIYNIWSLY